MQELLARLKASYKILAIIKRVLDNGNVLKYKIKCILTVSNMEDVGDILGSCPQISSMFYLPLRHNEVGKTFLRSHMKNITLIRK